MIKQCKNITPKLKIIEKVTYVSKISDVLRDKTKR